VPRQDKIIVRRDLPRGVLLSLEMSFILKSVSQITSLYIKEAVSEEVLHVCGPKSAETQRSSALFRSAPMKRSVLPSTILVRSLP
jgi:hypothetical protein